MNVAANFLRGVMGSLGQTMAIGQPINSAGLAGSIFRGAVGSVPLGTGLPSWTLPTFNGTPLPIAATAGLGLPAGYVRDPVTGAIIYNPAALSASTALASGATGSNWLAGYQRFLVGGGNPSVGMATVSQSGNDWLAGYQRFLIGGANPAIGSNSAGLVTGAGLDQRTRAFAEYDYAVMTQPGVLSPQFNPSLPLTPQQLFASAQAAGNNVFMNLPGLRDAMMAIAQVDSSYAANPLATLTSYFWRLSGGSMDAQGNMVGTVGPEGYINGLYGLSQALSARPANAQLLQQTARTSGIGAALTMLAQNASTITQPGTGITPQLRTQIQQFFVTPRSEQELAVWLATIAGGDMPATTDVNTLATAAAAFMARIGMSGPLDTALFANIKSQFPTYTLDQTLALYCFKRLRHTGGVTTTTGPTVRGQLGETITTPDRITGDEFLSLFYVATTTTPITPACPTCPTQYVQPVIHVASNPQPQIIQQPGQPVQVTQGSNTQHQEQHQNVYVTINMPKKKAKKKTPPPSIPDLQKYAFRIHGDPYVQGWGNGEKRLDEGGDLSFKKATSVAFADGSKMIVQTVPAGQTKNGDDLTFSSKLIYISPTGEVVFVDGIAQNKFKRTAKGGIVVDTSADGDPDGDVKINKYRSIREFLAAGNDASLLEVYNEVKQQEDGWYNASGKISGAMAEGETAKKITSSKAASKSTAKFTDEDTSDGTVSFVIDGKTFEIDEKLSEIIVMADNSDEVERAKAAAAAKANDTDDADAEDEMPEVIAETRNDDGTKSRVPIKTNINNNSGTQSQGQNDGGDGDTTDEDVDAA
jgi:hypothetical protein